MKHLENRKILITLRKKIGADEMKNLSNLIFEGTGEGKKENPFSVYVYLQDIPEDVEFNELDIFINEFYSSFKHGKYVECENTISRGKLEKRFIWHFWD